MASIKSITDLQSADLEAMAAAAEADAGQAIPGLRESLDEAKRITGQSQPTHLQKFAASSKLKVDMELAERFDFNMRRHGDKTIREQMAKARRAATMVENLLKDFEALAPKNVQVKDLESSAGTLRKLARSLEGLAAFAKAYQTFYLAEIKRSEIEKLEAFAFKRWGNDEAAALFEWHLIQEMETAEMSAEIGRWMHAQGRFENVALDRFHSPFHAYSREANTVRLKVASYLLEATDRSRQFSGINPSNDHCHMGLNDYESFLAARKAAASVVSEIARVSKSTGS